MNLVIPSLEEYCLPEELSKTKGGITKITLIFKSKEDLSRDKAKKQRENLFWVCKSELSPN